MIIDKAISFVVFYEKIMYNSNIRQIIGGEHMIGSFGILGPIGMWELILILVIALIIFGPGKLPEVGKALGKGIREFKNASKSIQQEISEDISEDTKEDKKEG